MPTRNNAGDESGISIVIPAYNEAAGIESVVEETHRTLRTLGRPFEIVVVDDASTDDTGLLASRAGAAVYRHPYNRGYGNSLKTGITAATHELVVICDADGSYPAEQIPRLLENAEAYDMVVGARTGRHFYGSRLKRLARWWQLKLVNYVTGTNVPDANSGFRMLRKSLALRYFDFVCSGFSFTTSITIALICEQCAIRFVNVDYHSRQGRSHVHYVRDTLRSLQIITHCILRYNPLKAFLLLAAFPVLLLPLIGVATRDWTAFGMSAAVCLCSSILVFAMGMLAYASGAGARRVDAGVYSYVGRPTLRISHEPADDSEADAKRRAA